MHSRMVECAYVTRARYQVRPRGAAKLWWRFAFAAVRREYGRARREAWRTAWARMEAPQCVRRSHVRACRIA